MKTWFLVLILTTPGQPSEHYVTLQTPDEETCETLRGYFAYARVHVNAMDADEPGTTMVVADKKCEPEEVDNNG